VGDPLGNESVVLNKQVLSGAPLGSTDDVQLGPIWKGGGPLVPPPPGKTEIFDEKTGTWQKPPRGNYEAVATYGEQGMAFVGYRMSEGWLIIDGPSGAGGHPYNSPGFDGVAFRVVNGVFELRIVDNKALSNPVVRSASALTTNLSKNLADLENHVLSSRFADMPDIQKVRKAITAARTSVAQGLPLPADVTLEVTNFGGVAADVGKSLRDRGIRFRDLNATTKPSPVGPAGAAAPESVEPSGPRALRLPPVSERLASPATAFRRAIDRISTGMKGFAGSAAGIGLGLLVDYFVEKRKQDHLTEQLKQQLDLIRPAIAEAAAVVRHSLAPGTKLYVNITVQVESMEQLVPEIMSYDGWPDLKIQSWTVTLNAIEHDDGIKYDYHVGWRLMTHRFTFSWELPSGS
jgi:hypothetical protein